MKSIINSLDYFFRRNLGPTTLDRDLALKAFGHAHSSGPLLSKTVGSLPSAISERANHPLHAISCHISVARELSVWTYFSHQTSNSRYSLVTGLSALYGLVM